MQAFASMAWLGKTLAIAALSALALAEVKRPLRRPHYSKLGRNTRNLAIAALSGATVRWLERPLVQSLSRIVERRRFGLLQQLPLPSGLRGVLGVVLMDYTLYLWHVLTHRTPVLWRFHRAHHADLDLDASTALRFHFGEMVMSIPYRAAQIAVLGIDRRTLSLWQGFLMVSILFHHSNLRLPRRFERRLARLIVTPRMHGIHHSMREGERNSNWSSGLTIWDRLHGTLKLDVPQNAIEIGIPTASHPDQVTLAKILTMPFR